MEISFKISDNVTDLLDKMEEMTEMWVTTPYLPQIASLGIDVIETYAPYLTGNLQQNLTANIGTKQIVWDSEALDQYGNDYAPIQEWGGRSTNMPNVYFDGKHYMEGASVTIDRHLEEALLESYRIIIEEDRLPKLREVWDEQYPPNPITGVGGDYDSDAYGGAGVWNNIDQDGNFVNPQTGGGSTNPWT